MIKPNPRWWGPCCWRREHPHCKCQWSRQTECNTPYAPPEIRPEQSPQNDIPSPWQGFLYDSSSAFILIFNHSKYNLIRQKIQIFLHELIKIRFPLTDSYHQLIHENRPFGGETPSKHQLIHKNRTSGGQTPPKVWVSKMWIKFRNSAFFDYFCTIVRFCDRYVFSRAWAKSPAQP